MTNLSQYYTKGGMKEKMFLKSVKKSLLLLDIVLEDFPRAIHQEKESYSKEIVK